MKGSNLSVCGIFIFILAIVAYGVALGEHPADAVGLDGNAHASDRVLEALGE